MAFLERVSSQVDFENRSPRSSLLIPTGNLIKEVIDTGDGKLGYTFYPPLSYRSIDVVSNPNGKLQPWQIEDEIARRSIRIETFEHFQRGGDKEELSLYYLGLMSHRAENQYFRHNPTLQQISDAAEKMQDLDWKIAQRYASHPSSNEGENALHDLIEAERQQRDELIEGKVADTPVNSSS